MEALKEQQPLISAEERQKRQEAVDFANANIGLDGLKVSPEAEQRQRQFVNGEISLEQLVNGEFKGMK
jgi:hypothetical protein